MIYPLWDVAAGLPGHSQTKKPSAWHWDDHRVIDRDEANGIGSSRARPDDRPSLGKRIGITRSHHLIKQPWIGDSIESQLKEAAGPADSGQHRGAGQERISAQRVFQQVDHTIDIGIRVW